jgi:monofunctional biosynthetic peptidoglycan transglycosylase
VNNWKGTVQLYWRKIKIAILFLFLFDLAYIIATKWANPLITSVMIKSWITGNGLNRKSIPYNQQGRNAKLAMLCSEDQLFPDHNGFDWSAIKAALKYNNNPKHKKTRGASTISQQTAKNVFLWNGRDWIRKGLEMYHTFLIEKIWGKKRILEVYMNVAETGKGLFGIEAAAQHYYNKKASELSKSEAAWIAILLPNPKVYNPIKPTEALSNKHAWVLKQMNNLDDDPETMKLINDE